MIQCEVCAFPERDVGGAQNAKRENCNTTLTAVYLLTLQEFAHYSHAGINSQNFATYSFDKTNKTLVMFMGLYKSAIYFNCLIGSILTS